MEGGLYISDLGLLMDTSPVTFLANNFFSHKELWVRLALAPIWFCLHNIQQKFPDVSVMWIQCSLVSSNYAECPLVWYSVDHFVGIFVRWGIKSMI